MHTLQSYEYVNLTVNYNDSPRGSRPSVVDRGFSLQRRDNNSERSCDLISKMARALVRASIGGSKPLSGVSATLAASPTHDPKVIVRLGTIVGSTSGSGTATKKRRTDAGKRCALLAIAAAA
ncbi:hypothetical protein GCM10027093_56060 [Paraburkholderia jirisanensis]